LTYDGKLVFIDQAGAINVLTHLQCGFALLSRIQEYIL